MLKTGAPIRTARQQPLLIDGAGEEDSTLGSEQKSTISAFLKDLQELGIGEHIRGTDILGTKKPSDEPADTTSPDWVPLEMSFGVPLFNEAANNSVCNKVRGAWQ